MKHSEGKWEIEDNAIYCDGHLVCRASELLSNEEIQANLKLMVSSPELLKALTIAEKYLHNADRELKNGKTLRQIVQEAIKNAT